MKTKVARKGVYRSFDEFEKAFLPDSDELIKSSGRSPEQSPVASLASELIEAVRASDKVKRG